MGGHWITETKGCHYMTYCSKCRRNAVHKTQTPYCPHCGVKMDGQEERIDTSIKSMDIPAGMKDLV
jgi:hypothetical protein